MRVTRFFLATNTRCRRLTFCRLRRGFLAVWIIFVLLLKNLPAKMRLGFPRSSMARRLRHP
jgi:hypothetical protein